jgi:hypothetical protein
MKFLPQQHVVKRSQGEATLLMHAKTSISSSLSSMTSLLVANHQLILHKNHQKDEWRQQEQGQQKQHSEWHDDCMRFDIATV